MEKYGTIPPKFTKAWWEHYWEYYKWHTIGTVFILTLSIITIVQLATKINYDLIVTYIGEVEHCSETAQQDVEMKMEETVEDVNGNGNTDVLFQILQTLNPAGNFENPQYESAVEAKKLLEIQAGEGFLFIMDKPQINTLYLNGVLEFEFDKADNWLADKEAERAADAASDYFVKVKSTEFFDEAVFDPVEVYVGIRTLRENESSAENVEKRNAAIEFANRLTK